MEDVKLSSSVLASGIDGLVIACRQYPNTITKELLKFLRPGFPFVIFSPFKEVGFHWLLLKHSEKT